MKLTRRDAHVGLSDAVSKHFEEEAELVNWLVLLGCCFLQKTHELLNADIGKRPELSIVEAERVQQKMERVLLNKRFARQLQKQAITRHYF